MIKPMKYLLCLLTCFLIGCSGLEQSEYENIRKLNEVKERIYRFCDEQQYAINVPNHRIREKYCWENLMIGGHHKITKEFFRCCGNSLNLPRSTKNRNNEIHYYFDCGGLEEHSLPIRNEKEFISPILIELLNYLQQQTGCKVHITCGHRCPKHNLYCDPSKGNRLSKHLIGGEVDFYIEGMENQPETIVDLVMKYYLDQETDPEFQRFYRYDKGDSNVAIRPWYNKEIFIKIFQPHEGRDIDNQHEHSYISIQVSYDRKEKRREYYTWDQAFNGYLRW